MWLCASRIGIIGLSFNHPDPLVAERVLEKITKAYVQFQADAVSTGTAGLTVAGQAADITLQRIVVLR